METVTIIIPIYNAEMYLKRCLDSVIGQSYPKLEILLVNDGSRDNSLAICEEYERKDERVLIIDKENTGVSDSRNVAMAAATGKYLQFMDSDDWLTPDATEKMVTLAEMTGCDLVIGDFYRVDGERFALKEHIDETKIMSRTEFAGYMMDDPADFYYGVMWNKLYKREIIEKHGLSCTTELSWCEDFLFNLAYIRQADSFCALQAPVYYYMKRKGSLVGTQLRKNNTVKLKFMLLEYYKDLYQSIGLYEDNKVKINGFVLAVAKDGNVNRLPLVGNAEKLDEELVLPKKEKQKKEKPEKKPRAERRKTETKPAGAKRTRSKPGAKENKEGVSHVTHTFEPVYNKESRILILGTFPSVKSRENHFYYGHPQNRFWKVLSALTGEPLPSSVEEKKELLLSHGIAVWDVVQVCDIKGSSDSSIRNVVPADIGRLLKETGITHIYGNGDMACRLYKRYCQEDTGMEIIKLPSTSPANAIFTMDRLTESWGEAILPVLKMPKGDSPS